jgi:hypothetical protein
MGANENMLGLNGHRRELLVEMIRLHDPGRAEVYIDALARLTQREAAFLKQIVETELLRTGFRADGEPTERGLDLQEIINVLYRHYPSMPRWLEMLDRELRETGLPLSAWGVNETAWDKKSAKRVTKVCADAGLAILGGDVWRQHGDGNWRATGDNWYSERRPREAVSAFVRRSRSETEAYLESYPDPGDGTIKFVVVCSGV